MFANVQDYETFLDPKTLTLIAKVMNFYHNWIDKAIFILFFILSVKMPSDHNQIWLVEIFDINWDLFILPFTKYNE